MFWEIVRFSPDFSVHPTHCEFGISVSKEFVEASRSRIEGLVAEQGLAEFQKKYNDYWVEALKARGMEHMIFSPPSFITFDPQVGLTKIHLSGSGCELYWHPNSSGRTDREGGYYETHNSDSAMHFVTFFLIFQAWAEHVEDEARKLKLIS